MISILLASGIVVMFLIAAALLDDKYVGFDIVTFFFVTILLLKTLRKEGEGK